MDRSGERGASPRGYQDRIPNLHSKNTILNEWSPPSQPVVSSCIRRSSSVVFMEQNFGPHMLQ